MSSVVDTLGEKSEELNLQREVLGEEIIGWQDKKDVLLKALFDMDNRKKSPGEIPTISHEKAAGALGVSMAEMYDLMAELEKENGYIDANMSSLNINTRGKRYVRENERQIKEVWQKYKSDKLENLGEN